jgi:hypothetical protein
MFKHSYKTTRPVSTVWFVCEKTADELAAEAAAAAAKAAEEARIAKLVQDRVDAEVTGLKKKNDELIAKNKTLAENNKRFDGVDLDALKQLKATIDANEDAKLIADGKGAQVIEKYTERMRAEQAAKLAEKDQAIAEQSTRADLYKDRVLENALRSAFVGLHPSAVEDAILLAKTQFVLDAKGNAVQLDSSGNPVLGKDGSSPFTPKEWIDIQKERKLHWFPASSSGSGAGAGQQGSGGAGKTMNRANFEKLDAAAQRTAALSGVKIID